MTSPDPLIIAVDDEPDDIFFLRRLIQKSARPHRFQPYANGEAAIAALSAFAAGMANDLPLLCFLDIKMVGMTGFDLLRWIREQKALDGVPVVMISSSEYPEDVDRARDLGAQAYLKKYPPLDALEKVLTEAEEFAAALPPKKTFLQWTYRFVDSRDTVLAK